MRLRLVLAIALAWCGAAPAAARADIAVRGPAATATYRSESTRTFTVGVPAGAQTGDVLVASIGFGASQAKSQPTLDAPDGWTLVTRTNQASAGALAVYVHVLAAGESSFTWTSSALDGGVAFVTAYGGVDTASPIDASSGRTAAKGTSVATPSVTTTAANATLVASYFGYRAAGGGTAWTAPSGMTERADAANASGSRSGSVDTATQASAGSTGTKTARTSTQQDYAIAALTALRPAQGATPAPSATPPAITPAGAAVPLIVDTDMYSDADDVGALATAFGLQLKGEAKVIAVVVNTRTSRPAVAANSWKCVAAIDSFYRSAAIPIGTSMPNTGTSLNSPDFIGPCAKYAPSSTPAPDTALRVYRRALAAQADGTVVITSVGYLGNLSALLNSPPDDISPLSGRDLVAHKVKTLVAMAGGYPARFGENNLTGDAAAAQNVAANWPTKLVWSGYEVGNLVHTGQTISSAHPAGSPVRAAYEAFVKPGNWIYSWDLTAVYHAVRPDDPLLREVGPGKNTVTSTGGNSFATGSGNQYYLTLSSATSLDASIEALLDKIPSSAPSDTAAPAISGVSQSGGAVSWTTDEPATTQVEYGTTTSYGSQTTLDGALTTTHRQTLSGLSAGTLYHYRVSSRDAAGNLATSPDATFTTPAPAAGPNDNFDLNTLDATAWKVTETGSKVTAANQELEITHPAGAWSRGVLISTPFDATGRTVRVQLKRAADDGQSGSTYGETGVFLRRDNTHYAYLFVAGGALTAWVNGGSGESNLTPSWPRYSATGMQWLRFRESLGTLYFEYAAGADAPGTWTTLASTPDPFALGAVTFELAAGSNTTTTIDVARFDNVATS